MVVWAVLRQARIDLDRNDFRRKMTELYGPVLG